MGKGVTNPYLLHNLKHKPRINFVIRLSKIKFKEECILTQLLRPLIDSCVRRML